MWADGGAFFFGLGGRGGTWYKRGLSSITVNFQLSRLYFCAQK
jgi:hypothetical protein